MPKCPKCGFVFTEEAPFELLTWFTKQPEREQFMYVCDSCGKKTHTAYGRLNNYVQTKSLTYTNPHRTTYFCLDCMRKYAKEDLLPGDRI